MSKNYKRIPIGEEQEKIIEEVRDKLENLGVLNPTYSEIIEALNMRGLPNKTILKKIMEMRGFK